MGKAVPSEKETEIQLPSITKNSYVGIYRAIRAMPPQALRNMSPLDIAALACELASVLRRPTVKRSRSISYVTEDVFGSEKVSFLKLVSQQTVLKVSESRLLDEVFCIIDQARKDDLYAGMYIYGIQGIEPSNVEIELPWNLLLSDADRIQAKHGYLHHELIYGLDRADILAVLREFVDHFNTIEINIKPSSSDHSTRKLVNITRRRSAPRKSRSLVH